MVDDIHCFECSKCGYDEGLNSFYCIVKNKTIRNWFKVPDFCPIKLGELGVSDIFQVEGENELANLTLALEKLKEETEHV